VNVAVLASGGGTNLQALLDAAAAGALGPARIVAVGSNVPGCEALARARRAGVATFALDHRNFAERAGFDQALVAELRGHDTELIVLAGFMRLLTPVFLDAFPQQVINIHPSLLPAFPGTNGPGQAFAHGVRYAGCTVHFVDAGTDSGPIIAQAVVPVLAGDDVESLRQRILREEHRLLPVVVRAVVEARVVVEGRRVRVTGATAETTHLRSLD